MALYLAAKDPDAAYRYTWVPAFTQGDALASATITVTSGTIALEDYEIDGDGVVLFVSGGANGETAVLAATADTNDGETLVETIYLPIRATANAFAYTARDVVDFALRKIVGNGASADAAEADDALERLNDMIAEWRIDGADIGVPAPLALGTVLAIPDEYISALKFNLRLDCHDFYGSPLTAREVERADTSKRNLVNKLTSFSDLSGPFGLSTTTGTVADLF